jgi:hypothetical protein
MRALVRRFTTSALRTLTAPVTPMRVPAVRDYPRLSYG